MHRTLSCQTDWWWKNFKDKPRLAAIKDQVAGRCSSITFFYLTSGVKLRWSTFQMNQRWKMGPEPARYSLAQLVYAVVLKTLTKEALSSVTSPTPLIKYFISNLQLETTVQTEATVSPLMLLRWHPYKAAVIELEKAQACLSTHPAGAAVRALGSLRRPEQTVGMTN